MPSRALPLLPLLLAARLAAEAGPALPTPVEAGVSAGVAVVVGAAPAEQLVRLANDGRILVQCVVADREEEEALRQRIDALGWTGVVGVRQLRGRQLPYVDDVADLVLVRDRTLAGDAEAARVTAPYGIVGSADGARWNLTRQPLPATMDEWPQTNRGPDQNAWSRDQEVAPFSGMRWLAPSLDSQGGRGKPPILLVNGSFVSFAFDSRTTGRLEARRAGSGALVWSVPSVPYQKEVQCDYLVANHQRVFTILQPTGPIVALDLATGEQRFQLADGPTFPAQVKTTANDRIGREGHNVVQCILVGDRLVVTYRGTVWVFDEATGKLRWKREFARTTGLWAAASEDAVLLAEEPEGANRGNGYMPGRGVRALSCLALADGTQRWRADDVVGPGDAVLFVQPTVFRDRVVLNMRYTGYPGEAPRGGRETSRGYQMVAHDLATGRRLWRNATKDRGGDLPGIFPYSGHYIDGDGTLWIGYISTATGVDTANGKVRKHYPMMVWNCHWARGVGTWYTAGQNFLDTATGGVSSSGSVRSACNNGSYFGYGATYLWSTGCPCGLFVFGKVALVDGPQPTPLPEAHQPQVVQPAVRPASADPADAWPGYMGGSWRNSAVAGAIPSQPAKRWSTALAAPRPPGPLAEDWRNDTSLPALTAPAVLGDTVVVAQPHAQRVVGLDAASGERRWSTLLGGRIEAPPALASGQPRFLGSAFLPLWITLPV